MSHMPCKMPNHLHVAVHVPWGVHAFPSVGNCLAQIVEQWLFISASDEFLWMTFAESIMVTESSEWSLGWFTARQVWVCTTANILVQIQHVVSDPACVTSSSYSVVLPTDPKINFCTDMASHMHGGTPRSPQTGFISQPRGRGDWALLDSKEAGRTLSSGVFDWVVNLNLGWFIILALAQWWNVETIVISCGAVKTATQQDMIRANGKY